MITIPKNEYVQPTEVREEVVQAICDVFLHGKVYHPHNGDNRGARNADRYVVRHKEYHKGHRYLTDGKYYDFGHKPFDWQEGIVFNGAEMKRAFDELQKAGYYMLRVYEYGSWMGYECHDKPFDDFWSSGTTLVKSFDDRID